MRVMISMGVVSALLGVPSLGEAREPPGGELAQVVVNSQKSLADAVGHGFRDEAWEYPTKLLPSEFPKLTHVSGPGDRGLSPKARWRRPVVLKDKASGVQLAVNCYHQRDEEAAGTPGTPAAPLLEPAYRYEKVAFYGLRAATASTGSRAVFAFRDGDLLFKIEAAGGEAESRQAAIAVAAEAIWTFRHPR